MSSCYKLLKVSVLACREVSCHTDSIPKRRNCSLQSW